MGQKVNPTIFRIGQTKQWSSKWFSDKNYAKFLQEDISIKEFLAKKLREASVARIEIERSASNITVIIHSAKPGVIIGRGGQGIEELKKKLKAKFLDQKTNLNINIQEVSNPNLSAELVVQTIALDLEKRVAYRRAMKLAISRTSKTNAKGVKVIVAGRLNGAEIARRETLTSGSLPLQTLRADIDYAAGTARTTYGAIGIKVWIYKGEKFKEDNEKKKTKEEVGDIVKKPKVLKK